MKHQRSIDHRHPGDGSRYLKNDAPEKFERPADKDLPRYREVNYRRDVPQNQRIETALQRSKDASDKSDQMSKIEGFDKLGPQESQEIKNHLVTEIPQQHIGRDRVERITYNDRFDLNEKGEQTYGVWHHNNRENSSYIEINQHGMQHDSAEINKIKETASHEIGHDVHARLDPEKKAQWETLSGKRPMRACVTDYARKDSAEDFAESYNFYITHNKELKKTNTQKYDFMKDEVFDGRYYGT